MTRALHSLGPAVLRIALAGMLVLTAGCQSQTESSRGNERPGDKAGQSSSDTELNAALKGDSDQLLAYIRKVAKVQLQADTREAIEEFVAIQKAIVRAVDELFARGKIEEDVRVEMIKEKWLALIVMARLEQPGAEEASLALTNEMINDKNRALAKMARLYMRNREVTAHMRDVALGKVASADRLLEDLRAILNEEDLGAEFDLADQAASLLESLEKYEDAGRVYAMIRQASLRAQDPDEGEKALKTAKRGVARLGLIGQQAEMKSTTLDGLPFDLAELKGKVVLIDFWATWCMPCVAEMPKLKQHYAKYRDRGFEVVGISLDGSKDQLDDFLAKERLPWVMLWTGEPSEEGLSPFESELPSKFGIDGIPSTFLIDQQGNVVALGLRGERLGEKLAELLGEPDETREDTKAAAN